MRDRTDTRAGSDLPVALLQDLARAGYYPELVADCLRTALGGDAVHAHLVHPETTFDANEVRRHVTVLVTTPGRLVVAHADDHGPDDTSGEPYAVCSTESVALARVHSVVVSQVVARPADHRPGATPAEVSLTLGWGALHRVDLEPASCPDPDCEADHGYTGSLTGDDLTVRIASAAEGADAVTAALDFARALSAVAGR
ncbi:DUF5998 family protein [Kineococcus sp. NPDC059986]|jgi:hypothetical protein|uniref:DUF5998 family protein n=1 Tax=Kineococcus sp. NPDC059986 TaxID=3155538 RepID=UPI00344F70DA